VEGRARRAGWRPIIDELFALIIIGNQRKSYNESLWPQITHPDVNP
jgi:hypothetical protein